MHFMLLNPLYLTVRFPVPNTTINPNLLSLPSPRIPLCLSNRHLQGNILLLALHRRFWV
jgi:hypothetical protein